MRILRVHYAYIYVYYAYITEKKRYEMLEKEIRIKIEKGVLIHKSKKMKSDVVKKNWRIKIRLKKEKNCGNETFDVRDI